MGTLVRGLLLLAGLLAAALGLAWMANPAGLAPGVDLLAGGAAGLNTLRGELGGLFAALGAFLLLGLRPGATGRAFLVAGMLLLAFIATGRLVGLAADGPSPQALTGLAVEVALLALCLLALRLSPRLPDPRQSP